MEKCGNSVEQLKQRSVNVPVLSIPEGTEGLVINRDAFEQRLRCVWCSMAKLSPTSQDNWSLQVGLLLLHDLELTTAVHVWRFWGAILWDSCNICTGYKKIEVNFYAKGVEYETEESYSL